jgi:hypothetical protein
LELQQATGGLRRAEVIEAEMCGKGPGTAGCLPLTKKTSQMHRYDMRARELGDETWKPWDDRREELEFDLA